jgi:hypothetical protein
MKQFLQSKKLKLALFGLGTVAILLIVFGLGLIVGYRHLLFRGHFEDNYYRNFYGEHPEDSLGYLRGRPPLHTHGVVGTVIDVASSTIAVRDMGSNDEQSVAMTPDTVVRKQGVTVLWGDIATGNRVAVIGAPNERGQIDAHFIRIFDASSSLPAGTMNY